MKTSYLKNINYNNLFNGLTYGLNPKLIVEIGILDGYSLTNFIKCSSNDTVIHAYDIFEEF